MSLTEVGGGPPGDSPCTPWESRGSSKVGDHRWVRDESVSPVGACREPPSVGERRWGSSQDGGSSRRRGWVVNGVREDRGREVLERFSGGIMGVRGRTLSGSVGDGDGFVRGVT